MRNTKATYSQISHNNCLLSLFGQASKHDITNNQIYKEHKTTTKSQNGQVMAPNDIIFSNIFVNNVLATF